MQLNSEIITTPPRASATVVLLRDDPEKGLQVFLLRRHTASAVLGGAFVFPGGKLDEADCTPDVHACLDVSSSVLQATLGESDISAEMAAGLYVAASLFVAPPYSLGCAGWRFCFSRWQIRRG